MKQSTWIWEVSLVNEQTGEPASISVKSHWSPSFEGIKEAIKEVAAIKAWWETGKKFAFAAIDVLSVESADNDELVTVAEDPA